LLPTLTLETARHPIQCLRTRVLVKQDRHGSARSGAFICSHLATLFVLPLGTPKRRFAKSADNLTSDTSIVLPVVPSVSWSHVACFSLDPETVINSEFTPIMLRRSHKKSRAGCSECKKRHIKVNSGSMWFLFFSHATCIATGRPFTY
jgi:hypothetical protein